MLKIRQFFRNLNIRFNPYVKMQIRIDVLERLAARLEESLDSFEDSMQREIRNCEAEISEKITEQEVDDKIESALNDYTPDDAIIENIVDDVETRMGENIENIIAEEVQNRFIKELKHHTVVERI